MSLAVLRVMFGSLMTDSAVRGEMGTGSSLKEGGGIGTGAGEGGRRKATSTISTGDSIDASIEMSDMSDEGGCPSFSYSSCF